jgi:prepilin-type N-terminal cleavage/methylation domain-containing protein
MLNKKAFTLIELLVVVLIIGILAAIALPRYEIAVEATRASEAASSLTAISRAVEMYKLAQGQPTNKFADLDTSINSENVSATSMDTKFYNYQISISPGNGTGYEVIATRINSSSQKYQYYIYINYARGRSCTAKTEEAREICDKLCVTPTNTPSQSNGYYYCPLK